ncbi:MAG: hypothetical protein ABEJ99_01875 [Candidatus Nanohaloarchaea archaeon]
MNRDELEEHLQEYKDENSAKKFVNFLKDQLVSELENYPTDSEVKKHDLNLMIRDIEEELDWVENEKLAEFDPEQQ